MQAQIAYCPRCGAPNGNPHGFCGRCGQVLGARPQVPAPAYRPSPPRPQQPRPAYPPPAYRPQAPPPVQRPAPAAPRYAPPPGYPPREGAGYVHGPGYGAGGQGLVGRAPAPARTISPPGGGAAASWGAAQPGTYHPGSFGYPVAAAPHAAAGARRHHGGLWAAAASLVAVILVGLLVIGLVAAIKPRTTSCTGSGCVVPPPKGAPLAAPHTYTSSTYHYSVRYYNTPGGYNPALMGAVHVTKETATEIDWSVDLDGFDPAGGTWPYGVQGMNANGQSAQQVVQGEINQNAQGGRFVYAIPNAMVGFVHGYGAVYDVQAQASNGAVADARYIVMAAVRNGLAVVFTALGPYNAKPQEHPDPTDTTVSLVVAPIVNGVTFPGMPVR